MVGTIADGELKAASARQRSPMRFALATREDDAAIRRLLRENPMRGAVTLTFEREPDYFLGSNIAGASDQVIVAFDAGRLVCMGRCTTRDAWVNGAVRRVAYLAELRLDDSARGRFHILRGGYQFFRELHQDFPADFSYTSIAADNLRARRFLERGLPGFPRYEHLGDLTTLLIQTRDSPFSCPKFSCHPFSEEGRKLGGRNISRPDVEELAEFFHRTNASGHLSAAWTAERIQSLAAHDLQLDDFGVVRKKGRVIAAAALWDQRRFRQTIVRGYSLPLRLVRPLANSVGRFFRVPKLPDVGCALPYASLSPLAIAAGEESILPDLVAGFCRRAVERGIAYLTLALPSDDSRLRLLRSRFGTRAYVTRLYRVKWPGDAEIALDHRPLLPDIALL